MAVKIRSLAKPTRLFRDGNLHFNKTASELRQFGLSTVHTHTRRTPLMLQTCYTILNGIKEGHRDTDCGNRVGIPLEK